MRSTEEGLGPHLLRKAGYVTPSTPEGTFRAAESDDGRKATLYDVTDETLRDYAFGPSVTTLAFVGGRLRELDVPDGVEDVACAGLGLERLRLPDSVRRLDCRKNWLRELELPERVHSVDAQWNLLTSVRFRPSHPSHPSGMLPRVAFLDVTGNQLPPAALDALEAHVEPDGLETDVVH
jgi:hypothetical protein